MALHLDVKRSKNVLVARLDGELDHHTAAHVRKVIEEELNHEWVTHLVLNLEKLEFMDSSGLGVILGRYKRVTQMGGKMTICSVQPSIERIMEMSGLFKILQMFQDESSAVSACGVAS
ncbi:anti-sigma F factor antagonist [Thermoactinomyces sp. DSM 45892]|uniref:anti-sigma F factor antagonist n=1 Tax=Thermoactinomyces sp. DSM 45892 TaxID=1882753 RepID=UPI000898715F|nr:anti-sigma F factor antagonist [Thermoactinomyces sp. DSM 45892]SDZ08669.1 anti-anti-sigma regulatory factor, SpoIIAA [Thermoactinomyces sp. DSM 45892]